MAGEYVMNWSSDQVKPQFTIQPRTTNNATNLVLYGKGSANYGEGIQEDLIRLLEHFASATPPGTQGSNVLGIPTTGQLWYDTTTQTMKVFGGNSWSAVGGGVEMTTTQPISPVLGALWFNTATSQLMVFDGVIWTLAGGGTLTGTTQPSIADSQVGQLWYNPDTNQLMVFDGTQYVLFNGTAFQNVQPVSPSDGQFWFNTTTSQLLVWNGTAWVPVSGAVTPSVTAPVNPYIGQLWYDTTTNTVRFYNGTIWDTFITNSSMTTTLNSLLSTKVSKTGDTMSGFLTLHANPISAMQAVTKQYVDVAIFNSIRNLSPCNPGDSLYQKRYETYATANQTIFTLPWMYIPGTRSTEVFINGVKQHPTSYIETDSNTITISVPLPVGTNVVVSVFVIGGGLNPPSTNGVSGIDVFVVTATASQTAFTLPTSYTPGGNNLFVYLDGIKQELTAAYTETSPNIVTFTTPLPVGRVVEFVTVQLLGSATIGRESLIASTLGQTVFPLATTYYHSTNCNDVNNVGISVYVSGVFQGTAEATEVGGVSIQLSSGVTIGTLVEVYKFNLS